MEAACCNTNPKDRTMKRFHVHAHVNNIAESVAFYSKLFGAQPTRVEGDYAKWMLDDPRINFAISARGGEIGIDHLGFQADDSTELAELKSRAESADLALLDEGQTTCCYARSEKHWVTDPQGIAWEQFHTLQDIPTFSATRAAMPAAATNQASVGSTDKAAAGCCATASAPRGKPLAVPVRVGGGCC